MDIRRWCLRNQCWNDVWKSASNSMWNYVIFKSWHWVSVYFNESTYWSTLWYLAPMFAKPLLMPCSKDRIWYQCIALYQHINRCSHIECHHCLTSLKHVYKKKCWCNVWKSTVNVKWCDIPKLMYHNVTTYWSMFNFRVYSVLYIALDNWW